jgi:hypothetical protein
MQRINQEEFKYLKKGCNFSKIELKERLLMLGEVLDPIDDNKKTYIHMYDSCLKDKTKLNQLKSLFGKSEVICEPSALKKKRERNTSKRQVNKLKPEIKQKNQKNQNKTPSKSKKPLPKESLKETKSKSKPNVPKNLTRSATRSHSKLIKEVPIIKKPEVKKIQNQQKTQIPKKSERIAEKSINKNITVKLNKAQKKKQLDQSPSIKIVGLLDEVSENHKKQKSIQKYNNFQKWKNSASGKKELINIEKHLSPASIEPYDFPKKINKKLFSDNSKDNSNNLVKKESKSNNIFLEKIRHDNFINNDKPQNLFKTNQSPKISNEGKIYTIYRFLRS